MSKRNPFRIAERIGNILLASFFIGVFMFVMFCLVMGGISNGWGWWSLLTIPGFLVGLAVILTLFALLGMGIEKLMAWWVDSKRAWEYKNRKGTK